MAIAPLAVTPGSGPREWEALERMSEEFHAAPAAMMLRYGIDVPARVAGPVLEGAGLSFRALKPRERGEGVVVRCVNLSSREVRGSWTWARPIRRAFLARLDEAPVRRLPLSGNRRQVRFTAAPRAIVTLLIES
jgi:hypothetical protein